MNWIRIACAGDLQDDEVLGLTINGVRIALYRSQGEFFATDNRCTHAEALMSDGYLEDGCIECPLHQARFDIDTGHCFIGPCQGQRLTPINLVIDDGDVCVTGVLLADE